MAFKHFTLEDRCEIKTYLDQRKSFTEIAASLEKNKSSISREVKSHRILVKTGCFGRNFNPCIHRYDCTISHMCKNCRSSKVKNCRFCEECFKHCSFFQKEECRRLQKAPYVCNGCSNRKRCSLEKWLYQPSDAQKEYQLTLSESRSGFSYSEEEILYIDSIVTPLVQKGQSLNHILANNRDILMISENTLYRMIESGILSINNMDLPRKIRLKPRKKSKEMKVDKKCRINRTYKDFEKFCLENPSLPITEMDSVIGKKGGKVLLTLHFVKPELMIAILRDRNNSQSVIDIINNLYQDLGSEKFISIMPLILTDNGSEFSNPSKLENDSDSNQRTHVFYCDPNAPGQKGSAEKNHEFIRYVIPKGTSLDNYTQDDINLMMNHINSYCRESLGNKCPYDVFEYMYGREILDLLGCHRIDGNEVTLKPSLLNRQ